MRTKRRNICGIYCIECIINGKIYIGQAQNIYDRWADHRRSLRKGEDGRVLQRAYDKYGEDNFKYWIICECEEKDLNDLETYFIAKWKTLAHENGYNIYVGGNCGNRGTIVSEETRKKLSLAGKGRKHSEESKDLMSKSKIGFKSRKNCKSIYVGVSRLPYGWRSHLYFKGEAFDLGCFETEIDAALAYNKKAIELFGEEANINIITENEKVLNLIQKEILQWNKVKNQKSHYRGVYKPKDYNCWVARIFMNGKRVKIGTFKNEIDAAIAYNKFATEYFGDKAKLNII
jgi:group I intron endonuclease